MVKRIMAIDVLRGMTIFFMIIVNTPGSWTYVYAPLKHAGWHGCTPTDLVFPFFLFVVGLSMAFSFRKYEKLPKTEWIEKVVKRTVLIFGVGLLLNWFPFYHKNIADLRILGVLQRIALAYGFASLMIIFTGRKWIFNKILLILLGYWALMYWMGEEGDPYSLEGNFARGIDILIFGENHVYNGFGIPFEPEGLISTLPAIGTVLLGYWIGILLQSRRAFQNKLKVILPYAFGGIGLGFVWNFVFPINKALWTSSYVVFTAGLAILLFCVLLYLIDFKAMQKWAYPFKVFGMNPLISYVLSLVLVKLLNNIRLPESSLFGWLYAEAFQPLFGNYFGSFMFALSIAALVWLFAFYLYRKAKVIKL